MSVPLRSPSPQMPGSSGTTQSMKKTIGHRGVETTTGETTYKKVRAGQGQGGGRMCPCPENRNGAPRSLRSRVLLVPALTLLLSVTSADHIICLKRSHPAGHHAHRRQPEPEGRARRSHAGLCCRGKHLLSQVGHSRVIIIFNLSFVLEADLLTRCRLSQ